MQSPPTCAVITPSYRFDLERCRLLVDSVERHVAPDIRHYLVIENRDLPMFRGFANARTEIIAVQDLIPWWLFRLPGFNRGWMSLKSLPVRNWIMQQLIKLSVPTAVKEDVLFYVDSDVFFARHFELAPLMREGRVPLFQERGQRGLMSHNDRWHVAAARMLGIPVQTGYDTSAVGQVIPWKRDNVLKLHAHLEKVAGRHWQEVLLSQLVFAEYILYAMFCEHILGFEAAGVWEDSVIHTHCYWDPVPLNRAQLAGFKAQLSPHHHSVMISAKSSTPVSEIRSVFDE